MRKIVFFLFIWNCELLAQNLLTNGDFENNIGAGYGKVYNAQTWEIAGQATQNNTPDLIGTGFYGSLGNNSMAFDQTGNFHVGWFGNESFATFLPYKIPSDRLFKIKFRYAFNSHNYNFIPETPYFTFTFSEDKPDKLYKRVGNCYKIDKPNKIKVQKSYQLNLEKITSDVWFTYESNWILPGSKDLGQWLSIIGVCSSDNITFGYQYIDDIEIVIKNDCPTCIKMNEPLIPGFTVEAGANFEAYIQSCATQKTDFQPISENSNEMLEDSTELLPKPTNATLFSISPNPFSASTTFNFSLPTTNLIHITDALGVLVYESKNSYEAGEYSLEWDASKVPSGVYFVQLQAGDFVQVKKIVKN